MITFTSINTYMMDNLSSSETGLQLWYTFCFIRALYYHLDFFTLILGPLDFFRMAFGSYGVSSSSE